MAYKDQVPFTTVDFQLKFRKDIEQAGDLEFVIYGIPVWRETLGYKGFTIFGHDPEGGYLESHLGIQSHED